MIVVKSLSRVRLFVTLWTIAHQAPLSVGFSRQEYWSGKHALLQGIFQTQGSNLGLPHHRQMLYPLSNQGTDKYLHFKYSFLSITSGDLHDNVNILVSKNSFTQCFLQFHFFTYKVSVYSWESFKFKELWSLFFALPQMPDHTSTEVSSVNWFLCFLLEIFNV